MYTSYIGQRLLALYNQHPDTACVLTARQFFEQQLYPKFFEPARYLQWVPNSPFAQAVAARDLVPGGPTAAAIRLTKLHRNIETVAPDASFVIGFPAAGVEGTTSGQVSNVGPVVSSDEIYCSWIGGALGVGVSGGLSLLLDEDDVLWALYEGWARYRTFLDQRPSMKGNQIDTWNGHWLAHVFGDRYDPAHPTDELEIKLTDTAGTLSMPTREWVQVLFALARHYPAQNLTAYVYSLAQTNRTIGFMPLRLPEVSKMERVLHEHLFLFPATLQSGGEIKLLQLYTAQYGFAKACQLGAIGLAAIVPDKLREYFTKPNEKPKNLTAKNDDVLAQLAFYQIWILAMLNNQGIIKAADQLAEALADYARNGMDERNAGRGMTKIGQQVEQVFVINLKGFISQLRELLEKSSDAPKYKTAFEEAVNHAMMMPLDNFPLFVVLTRFKYVARQIETASTQSSETSLA